MKLVSCIIEPMFSSRLLLPCFFFFFSTLKPKLMTFFFPGNQSLTTNDWNKWNSNILTLKKNLNLLSYDKRLVSRFKYALPGQRLGWRLNSWQNIVVQGTRIHGRTGSWYQFLFSFSFFFPFLWVKLERVVVH